MAKDSADTASGAEEEQGGLGFSHRQILVTMSGLVVAMLLAMLDNMIVAPGAGAGRGSASSRRRSVAATGRGWRRWGAGGADPVPRGGHALGRRGDDHVV